MFASRLVLLLPLLSCSEAGHTRQSDTPATAAPKWTTDAQAQVNAPAIGISDAMHQVPLDDPQAFVDITSLDSELLLDIRYATTRNFSNRAVYEKARCLLRAPVAAALLRVQARVRQAGLQLLIWDCYRPFHVQEDFWKLVPDARYVAKPVRQHGKPWRGSKHNRGAAIDLSLADRQGHPLEMPTDYDDFSERAHRDAEGTPEPAASHAKQLETAMHAEGFEGIATEWWHFDFKGWEQYPLAEEDY